MAEYERRFVEFPYSSQPVGIARSASDVIYYADSAARAIGRIRPDGAHSLISVPTLAEHIFGVAVDGDEQVWITEWSNSSPDGEPGVQLVSRLDPINGRYESASVADYGTPRNVVIGADGDPWFTTGLGLGHINSQGIVAFHEPDWISPWMGFEASGIAVSNDGKLWISVGGRLSGLASFDPSARHWSFFRLPQSVLPGHLAAAADGSIWFASFHHQKVGRLKDGTIDIFEFYGRPMGIIHSPTSGLWVTDFDNNRVVNLGLDAAEVRQSIDLNSQRPEPQCLLADQRDNIWITFQKGSVGCLLGPGQTPMSPLDSPSELHISAPTLLLSDLKTALKEVTPQAQRSRRPEVSAIPAIYSPHSSFLAPSRNLPVWRYIDLPKLVSILSNNALFFARLDSQLDRFEGSLPTRSTDDLSADEIPFLQGRPELDAHVKMMRQSLANFRSRALISCWHVSEYESVAMWDVYAQTGHGIAIRSDTDRLRRSLDQAPRDPITEGLASVGVAATEMETAYYMGLVRYIDYDRDVVIPATGLDYLTCKRKSYDYERELRLVVLSDLPVLGGQQISCDLSQLADAIYVSPTAPTWFYDAVSAVLQRFESHWAVLQSDLGRDPVL